MSSVTIVGGSGYVGTALGFLLSQRGYTIKILSRSPEVTKRKILFPCKVYDFNDENDFITALEGSKAVINLSGESVFKQRWSTTFKRKLLDSRVRPAIMLAKTLKSLKNKPSVYIQSSGINYYGSSDDKILDESNIKGKGFLSDIVENWEAPVTAIDQEKIRTVILRTGMVVGHSSQAIDLLGKIYSLHLGASFGNGNQWQTWIHINDLVNIIFWTMTSENISGIFNCVSPTPIKHKDFHRTLVKKYGFQTKPSVPSILLTLALGDQSSMMLDSIRAVPKRLISNGYHFKFDDFSDVLIKTSIPGAIKNSNHHIFQVYLKGTVIEAVKKLTRIGIIPDHEAEDLEEKLNLYSKKQLNSFLEDSIYYNNENKNNILLSDKKEQSFFSYYRETKVISPMKIGFLLSIIIEKKSKLPPPINFIADWCLAKKIKQNKFLEIKKIASLNFP